MTQENQKRGEERKRKVKVKTAMSLLNPKTRNFAFCICSNFVRLYFVSESEGREMYDLTKRVCGKFQLLIAQQ